MATAPQLDLEQDSKIEGDLGSVGLNDLLQMMGMARRSGTIRVTFQGREGKIVCKEGEVLHAVAGSAVGEQALARLVRWTEGKFSIEDEIEDEGVATIAKSADAAVLEVLRKIDEGEEPDVLFTPFEPLDRPDPSELAAVARKVRAAKLRPRRPTSRSNVPFRAIAIVALMGVVGLGGGAGYLYHDLGLGSFPELPNVSFVPPLKQNVTPGVLSAALGGGSTDARALLAGYGVDWAPRPVPESTPVAAVSASTSAPSVAPAEVETASVVPGTLLILVEPWANVRLDGVDLGETPLAEISVSPGLHDIVLSNPGIAGVLRNTVDVLPGESKTVRFSLASTGSLRVVVTPWAEVYVDGNHIGQTPMDTLELPLGTHTLRFSHPQLGEKTKQVEVRAGEVASLKVEM